MSISFARRGAGDPIVLVHGIGSRWQVFEPILDTLVEAGHEVIAVDLPGFGASSLPAGVAPGPRGYADWLAGWLPEQGIERPHLVGSSMGGGIGIELGRRGIASAVTAFSPAGFWREPGLRWVQGMITTMRAAARTAGPVMGRAADHRIGRDVLLGGFFGQPGKLDPDTARADMAALAGAPAYAAACRDFARYRLDPADDPGALRSIPVTIAWGTRDVVLLHRTQSARAREVLPFATHVDLPRCGHLPFSDDPAACARLVLADARRAG
ncbi:alpha/beta fold hydrolase [Nocardioides ultimimeridianus]